MVACKSSKVSKQNETLKMKVCLFLLAGAASHIGSRRRRRRRRRHHHHHHRTGIQQVHRDALRVFRRLARKKIGAQTNSKLKNNNNNEDRIEYKAKSSTNEEQCNKKANNITTTVAMPPKLNNNQP
jgi:hypothetical protein